MIPRIAAPTRLPRSPLLPIVLCLLAPAFTAQAADAGGGAEPGREILQELRAFGATASLLHVGAHPDDENTQLITSLARGRGFRTAYLSITRGDGGQNEIGPEFGEKLGVARTQELLAARRMDGGMQFFTRAIDFGFSKSPEETLRIWNRDQVLADVVRVIRKFQPDVIVTRFPPPPGSGGHGHHTASAILAVEAFRLAGDPAAFPEQLTEGLRPWQAKRVVWNEFGAGRGANGLSGPTVTEDIGGADPVTGEPFGTIANQSRGMHKTQSLGGFAGRAGGAGPNMQAFLLLAGEPAAKSLWDGIDTTWRRIEGGDAIAGRVAAAIDHFDPGNPAVSIPALLAIRDNLRNLPGSARESATALLDSKGRQIDRIIAHCLGLSTRTTVRSAEVVPGEKLSMHHVVALTASVPVRWVSVRYPVTGTVVDIGQALNPGSPAACDSVERLPADSPPSQPYWLRGEGTPGMFRVDDPRLIGLPENPPAFPVEMTFSLDGRELVIAGEPVQELPDAPRAQQHRRLEVIPPVSIEFTTPTRLFPIRNAGQAVGDARGASRDVAVTITAARPGVAGTLRLSAPAGWTVEPESKRFAIAQPGETVQLAFHVAAPDQPAEGDFTASADVGGERVTTGRFVIRYPHLPVMLLQSPARCHVVSLDLQIRGKRVGYVPGAGDDVAGCLEQMGYEVTVLRGPDLAPERLRGIDAVVLGVRAWNERDDLAGALAGLFAYVEAGGTVVAQYNRPTGLKARTLGPYELSIEGPAPQLRVTDEDAPVTILAPDHPALNTPNLIGPGDFSGWVQERGAYYPSRWDTGHYTALLAMNDTGEDPLTSSVLVCRHGKGWFVYTGLSFFRQLPAGVPGAYRLFANLVSLGK